MNAARPPIPATKNVKAFRKALGKVQRQLADALAYGRDAEARGLLDAALRKVDPGLAFTPQYASIRDYPQPFGVFREVVEWMIHEREVGRGGGGG
jgi:hypothetical protein